MDAQSLADRFSVSQKGGGEGETARAFLAASKVYIVTVSMQNNVDFPLSLLYLKGAQIEPKKNSISL